MKRIGFLLLCWAVTAASLLTSCSKNDEESSAKISSVKIAYKYYTTQDMLDKCDISLKYIDVNGKTQTVNMNNETFTDTTFMGGACKVWRKPLTITKSPTALGALVTITPMASADFTTGKMNFFTYVSIDCFVSSYSGLDVSTVYKSPATIQCIYFAKFLESSSAENTCGYNLSFNDNGVAFTQQTPSF